jgi:hypothetical protein
VKATRAIALAAASLALLLAPTAASAAPHKVHTSFPATASAAVHLPASDGYRLDLEATLVRFSKAELAKFTGPAPATETFVSLVLRRGPAEASYFAAEPTFDGETIEEDLGELGEVSLRFVPGQVSFKRPLKGCVGPADRIEHGAFVGVLRFRGEHGYAHLLRRRVPGTLSRQASLSCDLVPKDGSPNGLRVGGTRLQHGGGIAFEAQRRGSAGVARLDAYDSETRGGITVERKVEVEGPAGTLSVEGLTGAAVTPPAPFSGEARFKAFEGKQSGTWLGSLAVSFPGAPDVSLAGREFEGSLLTGHQCSVDRNVTCLVG